MYHGAGKSLRRFAAGAASCLACVSMPIAVSACGSGRRLPLVEVVQTNGDLSQRLAHLGDLRFTARRPAGLPVIHVEDATSYQRITGVGAALTDTSAWLLHEALPPGLTSAVLQKLFGLGGIRLDVVRIPIGATDFTHNGRPYSYDDVPAGRADPALRLFSVKHDEAYIIPTLRQILRINPQITTLASPWTPPAWMKTNQSLGNHADGGRLLAGAYRPLAEYFVRFIRAYERRGVRVDAISPQNEPGQGANYPGLNLPVAAEARFISRYLAPSLGASRLHPMIYGHDYKWLFWRRVATLLSYPAVAHALTGIAWHCYDGTPTVMSVLHDARPGLDQIESECSSGASPGPPAELMIASFRNWASSVLLWNIALDPRGGPVQPPNRGCPYCVGVVTVDEHTHTVSYGRDYYELGQFSAFVRPGARRIGSNTFVRYNSHTHQHRVPYATAGVDDVAFRNPDGSNVLLVHNTADARRRFVVEWRHRTFTYTLPARATVTFVWR